MPNTSRPWYRHPIMWLVVFPPFASVLAGIITVTLIIKYPDHDVREETVVHNSRAVSNSVVPPAQ